MQRALLSMIVLLVCAGCAEELPEAEPAARPSASDVTDQPPTPTPYDPFRDVLAREMASFANVTLRATLSADRHGYEYHAVVTNEGASNATIVQGTRSCYGRIEFAVIAPSGSDMSQGGPIFCDSETTGDTELAPGASISGGEALRGTYRDASGFAHEPTPGEYLLVAMAIVAGEPYGGVLQQSVRVPWPPPGYVATEPAREADA